MIERAKRRLGQSRKPSYAARTGPPQGCRAVSSRAAAPVSRRRAAAQAQRAGLMRRRRLINKGPRAPRNSDDCCRRHARSWSRAAMPVCRCGLPVAVLGCSPLDMRAQKKRQSHCASEKPHEFQCHFSENESWGTYPADAGIARHRAGAARAVPAARAARDPGPGLPPSSAARANAAAPRSRWLVRDRRDHSHWYKCKNSAWNEHHS